MNLIGHSVLPCESQGLWHSIMMVQQHELCLEVLRRMHATFPSILASTTISFPKGIQSVWRTL